MGEGKASFVLGNEIADNVHEWLMEGGGSSFLLVHKMADNVHEWLMGEGKHHLFLLMR
jgi:hypothetical protein